MPCLTIDGDNNKRLTYIEEGEGFPLLIVPAVAGRIADWAPQLPLLGELCRVMAYEYSAATDPPFPDRRVQDLQALLDALAIRKAYLAGYADGGLTALRLAWRYPQCVAGLLLIGMDRVLCEDQLGRITVPACAFVGAEATQHMTIASHLAAALSYGEQYTITQAATVPHQEQPLALGHAMMDFLMRCERQRNLVRGASFLL